MKFLIKTTILFFCIFTAGASNVQCFSLKCKLMLEPHAISKSSLKTLSSALMSDGGVYALTNKDGNVYAGTSSGNVWSFDGTNWSPLGSLSSLDGNYVATVAALSSTNVLAGTASGYVWQWDGTTWHKLTGSSTAGTLDNSLVDYILNVNGMVFVGTDRGNVFKRVNNAWFKFNGSGPAGTINSGIIGSLAADSEGYIYATTTAEFFGYYYGNVWKHSTDSSGTWEPISGDGYFGSLDNSGIWSVSVDNANKVHAGTFMGKIWKNIGVDEWEPLPGSAPDESLDNSIIWSTVFNSGTTLFAATMNGNVFRHTSGGWSLLDGGGDPQGTLDGSMVWSLTYEPIAGYLYASTDYGNVFVFNGIGWTQI